jgi:hypothetical protein
VEHQPLPEPGRSGPAVDETARRVEPTGAVHLARFNVVEVDDIERAIASHLGVSRDHLASEGFVVIPEAGHLMRIVWESSAAIDIQEFQAIVDKATEANGRKVPRSSLPEPHGPIARPRRKVPRRARRTDAEEST